MRDREMLQSHQSIPALMVEANMGPGPRDRPMTGIAARGRFSIRGAGTVLEVTALIRRKDAHSEPGVNRP